MLAAKFRFHGYGSLKFLFGHGKTWRFKSLSLRVAPNSRRVHSRVAVIISKKVVKASPKRNRVRRRVYEIVRAHWQHLRPGHDILITVYDPHFGEAPFEEVNAELVDAFQRAGLWQDEKNETSQE